MSMPGFTADLAVYKTSQHYRTGSTFNQANSAGIRPALFPIVRPITSPRWWLTVPPRNEVEARLVDYYCEMCRQYGILCNLCTSLA